MMCDVYEYLACVFVFIVCMCVGDAMAFMCIVQIPCNIE